MLKGHTETQMYKWPRAVVLKYIFFAPVLSNYFRPQAKSSTTKRHQSQKGRKQRKQETSDEDEDDDDEEEDTPKRQTRRRAAAKVRQELTAFVSL